MRRIPLFCFIILLLFVKLPAQDHLFRNADVPTKCELIKEGIFISSLYSPSEWTMTVKGNVQTEYYDDGKKFVKIIQYFDEKDPCKYELVVLNDSNKEDDVNPGDRFVNTIIATQGDLIKIRSESKEKGVIIILKRIKKSFIKLNN